MNITSHTENDIVTITIDGEIDASNAVVLDTELEQVFNSSGKKVYLNGEKLSYISSAGLGVLMSYIKDIKEKEIIFTIYGLSAQVFEVFQILGLDLLLTIEDRRTMAPTSN